MSAQKILAAVITGAAIGLAIGILIAPDEGSETRRKLAEKAGDMLDKTKKVIDNTKDMVSAGKEKVSDMLRKSNNSYADSSME